MSRKAIIAARRTDARPGTTEIRGLAETVGYDVIDEVTQRRAEDPTYGVGRGKAEELMRLAAEREADAVVYDGELTPGQTASLTEQLPDGVEVVDRTRLVLGRFADGAGSRAARLQVELARLRYLKPRLRERMARDAATEIRYHNEDDRRILDVERRIETLERALQGISDARAERRERRRQEGFDLVAIAGYTNAGKSTLLHRLADDHDVENDEPDHDDLHGVAEIEDRLFETLETTTRRATVRGRRVLLTDTVGFVESLPHETVRSFQATIDAVRNADAVLLVADATDDPDTVGERLRVSLDAVDRPDGPIVPVLNKIDRFGEAALAERRQLVESIARDWTPAEATAATDESDRIATAESDRTPPTELRRNAGAALLGLRAR